MEISTNNINFSGGYRILGYTPEGIKKAIASSKPLQDYLASSAQDMLIRVRAYYVPKHLRYRHGLDVGEPAYNVLFSLSRNKNSVLAWFFDLFAKHARLSNRPYDEERIISRLNSKSHLQQRIFSELV